MPGLRHDPGDRAGPGVQKNRLEVVKMHYTVGVNSYNLGKAGYFTWLVPREGTPTQFAPVNNACWDSGEWNDAGPGIEFEFYEPKDGPAPQNIVTSSQVGWGGKIARWLHTAHGFPLAFYDGTRVAGTGGWRGFITHRSLIQAEQHTDYITAEQWGRMLGPAAPPAQSVNWAALRVALHRRWFAMWLIRDSRTGGIYVYDGQSARLLDGTTLQVQKDMMTQLGLPTNIANGQDYLVDRLREQGQLVG
jgi:hypothetical protein